MPWAQVPAIPLISYLSISENGNPILSVAQAQNHEISLDSTLKVPSGSASDISGSWSFLTTSSVTSWSPVHHFLLGLLQQLPNRCPHFPICPFVVSALYSRPADLYKSCQNILFLCLKISSILSSNALQKVKYLRAYSTPHSLLLLSHPESLLVSNYFPSFSLHPTLNSLCSQTH